ncbi:YidH family protein [Dissulfuribacter thermophilus]|uniref:YidH family protein n=1 Tax=Dissulfuribacter thermophilus TaxID=1156395 RepID=UPI000833A84A|nr:DUF202 domain-containing protein [Dissulfuribacter thermophilus]
MRDINPRDLWALNRTILALCRTSISMIVLGFVIKKFDFFLEEISSNLLKISSKDIYQSEALYHYMGLSTTLAGIVLCIYTIFYYKRQLKLLKEGKAHDDEYLFYAISLFIMVLGVALFGGMLFL